MPETKDLFASKTGAFLAEIATVIVAWRQEELYLIFNWIEQGGQV